MISIFNGRKRSLGEGGKDDIYVQVSVALRSHLHAFKNSSFIVFMAICLHSNQDGEAWPSIDTLCRETGRNAETVKESLAFLRDLRIEGARVLATAKQTDKGKFAVNRYLVFPTEAEAEVFTVTEKPQTEKPTTVFSTTVSSSSEIYPPKYNQGIKENQYREEPVKAHTQKAPCTTARPVERCFVPGNTSSFDFERTFSGARANIPSIIKAFREARGYPGAFAEPDWFANHNDYTKLARDFTPEEVTQAVQNALDGAFSGPEKITPGSIWRRRDLLLSWQGPTIPKSATELRMDDGRRQVRALADLGRQVRERREAAERGEIVDGEFETSVIPGEDSGNRGEVLQHIRGLLGLAPKDGTTETGPAGHGGIRGGVAEDRNAGADRGSTARDTPVLRVLPYSQTSW